METQRPYTCCFSLSRRKDSAKYYWEQTCVFTTFGLLFISFFPFVFVSFILLYLFSFRTGHKWLLIGICFNEEYMRIRNSKADLRMKIIAVVNAIWGTKRKAQWCCWWWMWSWSREDAPRVISCFLRMVGVGWGSFIYYVGPTRTKNWTCSAPVNIVKRASFEESSQNKPEWNPENVPWTNNSFNNSFLHYPAFK